jgi:hypothetical protein
MVVVDACGLLVSALDTVLRGHTGAANAKQAVELAV